MVEICMKQNTKLLINKRKGAGLKDLSESTQPANIGPQDVPLKRPQGVP